MAVNATVAREQRSAKIELGRSGHRVLVALAATGFDVACGQDRLFACAFAPMRLDHCGGLSLAAVTDDAAEAVERVRNNRVFAEWLLIHIGKTRLLQSQVARRAAIDHPQFRKPDLVNAWFKAAAQTDGVSTIANQRSVVTLIGMPLAEVFLRRRNRQCQQEDQADHAECPYRIAEQRLPRRGKKFSHRLHLTPPGPYPGPARAAEPCAHRGEHDQFKEKPCHDPVSERLPGQVPAQARGRIRACSSAATIIATATIAVGATAT